MSPSEKLEYDINSVASIIGGKITIPMLYLGLIYITMYYYTSGGHEIIRIVIFIIIVFIFTYYIYPELIISLLSNIFIGMSNSLEKFTSTNSTQNITDNFKLLSLDIYQIIMAIIHVIKNIF